MVATRQRTHKGYTVLVQEEVDHDETGIFDRIRRNQCRKRKHLIETVDGLLAKGFGLTDEELDFIVNYDIKYRLGADADEDEE